MICPNCSTENLAGAKFCMECAAPLNAGCPNCGFANLPNAKFCSECATPLSGVGARVAGGNAGVAAPAPVRQLSSAPPEAERRLVSILFADLVGFTPFAEERDSEDVRETLTKYFDLARDVIERYGGTVEKFIGDAVMAVWGAPVAQADDAELAVRAALELVASVKELGPSIEARAGVLTGEAAVTIGATNQGMVAGDIVNTASRLQSVAAPGTVLVGEATHRAASAAVAFEEAGEQTLKGKQAPIPAWRALRVVSERGGRNRSETLEAPFVGRAEEIRLLKDLFHTTGREQRLRVVSVIGLAGIGKSRLAREFSIYIDGLLETVYWHSGRSPAYGEGITFWALGEMVRERAGLAESDDEATTRAKVKETVAQWVSDESERRWIEPALLVLLGYETGIAADQLFGAWRTFFERIAAHGPVALVFEDMHFADTGLLDFIDHLLDFSRGVPLYVVTLARPDLIERRPGWGAGKRNFFSMYLEPLPETSMRELLAGLVPGLPAPAVASIVARADGIPLYAVETIRTLVADGRLVEEGGVYVPNGDLTTLAVPETLTALIASRLDALDETDRRLVHDAAVLGHSFSAAALAAVADVDEAELETHLNTLVRRELLRREMDARSPERGHYAFVQALIREVAYNTLSKKDRKKLHLAAARYFESLGNDEIAGALASHYLAAHASAGEGDESDALAGQARIALKAAATRAASLGSFDQSVTLLEQALTVTNDPHEQVELLRQAGSDARVASLLAKAEELMSRSRDIATEIGDRRQMARTTAALSAIVNAQFRAADALELVEGSLEEFADVEEDVRAELGLSLGRAVYSNGDFYRSLELLERVLEVAERRGLMSTFGEALLGRANALTQTNRRREAVGVLRLAADVAAENGLTYLYLRAAGNGTGLLAETDVRAAVDAWRNLVSVARKAGQRASLLNAVSNLGYTSFLSGEWDSALADMEQMLAEDMSPRDRLVMLNDVLCIRAARGESIADGLAEMEALGKAMSGPWHLYVADPEANAAMARGDFNRAREVFLSIADEDPGQAPEYLYRAARAMLWQGDGDAAAGLLQRFEESGAYGRIHAARLATLRGGIAALHGRSAEAVALYRDASRDWHAAGAGWDEALTGVDMAELLGPADPEVAAIIAAARATLEQLRAQPYVDRIDAAVARAPVGVSTKKSGAASRAEVTVPD